MSTLINSQRTSFNHGSPMNRDMPGFVRDPFKTWLQEYSTSGTAKDETIYKLRVKILKIILENLYAVDRVNSLPEDTALNLIAALGDIPKTPDLPPKTFADGIAFAADRLETTIPRDMHPDSLTAWYVRDKVKALRELAESARNT